MLVVSTATSVTTAHLGWLALLLLSALVLTAVLGGRQVRIGMLLSAASILFSLVLVEALLRVPVIGDQFFSSGHWVADSVFHHNYPANAEYTRRPSAVDEFGPVSIETNSLRMRGPEPVEGEADILLIGDSFIQADQVEWNDLLHVRLNSRLRSDSSVLAVVGHGFSSWSPLLEWNWYVKTGRRFQPRLVMAFVLWNDFLLPEEYSLTDLAYLDAAVFDEAGRPVYFRIEDATRGRFALERLRTYRLARFVAYSARKWSWSRFRLPGRRDLTDAQRREYHRILGEPILLRQDETSKLMQADDREFETLIQAFEPVSQGFWRSNRPLGKWSSDRVRALDRSAEIIERFADDVSSDGARFVLVYVPHPWQIGPEECRIGRYHYNIGDGVLLPESSGVQEWLRGIADALGVTFLDPTPEMRSHINRGGEHLYFRADCHWAPRGHEFMADYLAEWLRSSADDLPLRVPVVTPPVR